MPGFIIDLDGTMYAGTRPIHRAAEFIAVLRERRLPFLFVTNNSSRTPEQVAEHLRTITGITADATHILTTAQAAARYIADSGSDKSAYCIGETGLYQALREAGVRTLDIARPGDLTGVRPGFVVQGIDRDFNYVKLEIAVRLIQAGAASVLTNPDLLLPTEHGFAPGAGALAAAVEAASGRKPVIIGKPSPIIMNYAITRLGVSPGETWVVGDNLRTDIHGGIAAGCRTALVLTGVAAPDKAAAQIATSGISPDLVCRDLAELLQHVT